MTYNCSWSVPVSPMYPPPPQHPEARLPPFVWGEGRGAPAAEEPGRPASV